MHRCGGIPVLLQRCLKRKSIMRGKHFLALSFCTLLFSACSFEQRFGESSRDSYNDVGVTVRADVDGGVAEALGGLWKSGDALKMRLDGAEYEGKADFVNLVTSSAGVTDVAFEGMLPSYRESDNAYIYYSAGGGFVDHTGYRSEIPAVQTGRLEDIRDSLMFFSWVRNDSSTLTEGNDGISKVEMECSMSPAFALLKLNIPAELGAKDVTVEADAPLTGAVRIMPQRGWGTIGENEMLYWEGTDTLAESSVISLQQESETLSGDIYLAILPDSYDLLNDVYCSSASTIRLKCAYYDGDDYTHRIILDDNILCGEVCDLGQLPMPKPKVPVEGGSLCLLPTASLTVAVADANGDCEYYYELGTSEEDCPKPTVKSTPLADPAAGFSPELNGTDDRYFIKVLVHALDNDHRDVVLSASLRNWSFKDGCPTGVILADAFAGNSLTAKGDEIPTSDGLLIKRMQDYKEKDLKFEQTSARIALVSAKVAMYMPVEQDSNVSLWFCIDKKTCIGSGQRAFNLYYNENTGRVNELNGNPVKTVVKGSEASESGKMAILWPLGDLSTGDRVSPAGDGQHVLYSMALLEVL